MNVRTVLKKIFIPHKDNHYKPHFFREHIVLSLLVVSITLLLVSFSIYTILRTTSFGSAVITSVVVDLTNKARKNNNLPPLSNNVQLEAAAILKGNDMVRRKYFSHYAPDGTSPWHWFDVVHYPFVYAGENLAFNFTNAQDVENAWLNSPLHRDNILNEHYVDTGVAAVHLQTDGDPFVFIVQLFGKEASTTALNASSSPYKTAWYNYLLFNASYYTEKIYLALLALIITALILMIVIEIRIQHWLHIFYGIILTVVVILCALVNALLLHRI